MNVSVLSKQSIKHKIRSNLQGSSGIQFTRDFLRRLKKKNFWEMEAYQWPKFLSNFTFHSCFCFSLKKNVKPILGLSIKLLRISHLCLATSLLKFGGATTGSSRGLRTGIWSGHNTKSLTTIYRLQWLISQKHVEPKTTFQLTVMRKFGYRYSYRFKTFRSTFIH